MLSRSLFAVLALLLVVVLGWASTSNHKTTVVELKAAGVLPIEAPFVVEPSGLCLRDGRLYSVSDDTDNMIFEIVLEDDVARFVPAVEFSPPEGDGERLDLEGIAVGPNGSFYVASEWFARVLQVFPDGTSAWVTPSGLAAGKEGGLFQVMQGRVEGLTHLPGDGFLMAAERQPRGLLSWSAEDDFNAQAMPRTQYSAGLSPLRIPDFTGLDRAEGQVWALARNASMVMTVKRIGDEWREGRKAWSYRSIVDDPAYAYEDTRFGQAEGLAVGERHFYVVIDNNRDARAADPTDRRPLLLVLERPQ